MVAIYLFNLNEATKLLKKASKVVLAGSYVFVETATTYLVKTSSYHLLISVFFCRILIHADPFEWFKDLGGN